MKAEDHLGGPAAFVAHYLRARAGAVAALVTIAIVAAAGSVGVQYAMKLLVDVVAGPAEGRDAVWAVLALFLVLIAAECACWRAIAWLACRVTVNAGVEIRLDLFDRLARQPMRFFSDSLAGALAQRVTAAAGSFGAFLNTLVWRILPPCVDFLGALVIFATVHPGMAGALACLVGGVTPLLMWFGERGRTLHRAYVTQASAVSGELIDTVANIWAVKAFRAQERESGRLCAAFTGEAGAQRTSWMHVEKARAIHDVILCTAAGAMLAWAILLWSRGAITPGDVVVVSALTFRILHGSRDLALSLVEWTQQFVTIDESLKALSASREAPGATHGDPPDAPALVARGGAVEFRAVGFGYRPGQASLADLSFSIPAGQKVGIVGPSGAGKSTIVQLLQRLYEPGRGAILIDGQPIAGVARDSLGAALGVVPQEILLFHRTIIDNIRFARPEADDEEVFAAARAAHCDAFIRGLPDGYATIVGERGTKLSGGQRQRIGIARAFLKDSPIVVLDEATSALDTRAEMEVQRALVELMRERTVIAVAHRLSTLAAFDRVLVIEEGRLVEDGPPDRLGATGGPFARMLRLQAERAPEPEAPALTPSRRLEDA